MAGWIGRIVIAAVFAVVAYLVCILVGGILATLAVPVIVTVGHFLQQWAGLIACLVFLWYLFVGYQAVPWTRRAP